MSEEYFTKLINICKKANEELSEHLKDIQCSDLYYTGTKGAGGDDMMYIDKIAEDIFVKHLLPYANIQSEESGYIKSNITTTNTIYLDPIDGSDNLRSSLPYYATSIALQIQGLTKLAFIYNLVNNTYFYKTPYKSNIIEQKVQSSLGIFERAYSNPKLVQKLHEKNIKFRSPGAVSLSIANTYNYLFFLLEANLRKEDICAGLYICEDLNIFQTNKFLLICKNITIFNVIKEILKDI